MIECVICEERMSGNNIRIGVCWECAEAESIIFEGLDMYDKGPRGDDSPAKTAREKLEYLIEKGWIWGVRSND